MPFARSNFRLTGWLKPCALVGAFAGAVVTRWIADGTADRIVTALAQRLRA